MSAASQRRDKRPSTLPSAVWERIIPMLDESSSLSKQDLLLSLGRECSLAMRRDMYAKVSLPNLDDALLIATSGELSCPLQALCASPQNAQLVTSLVVSEPHTQETGYIYALDQAALSELLEQLDLQSFSWKSCLSAPSIHLGDYLSTSLTYFECSLIQVANPIPSIEQSSPPAEEVVSSFYQPRRVQLTRWNGALLACLPASLTTLVLGSLDHQGIKRLTATLENLPSLQHLTLSDSQFVDDALLQELAIVCPSFTALELKSLRSSKLTDVGIHAMLEGCETLQSLMLVDVESRLSKNCWEIEPCPAFSSIIVSFTERSQVYSWTGNHLRSIGHLLSHAGLKVFSLTRKVDLQLDRVAPELQLKPCPIALYEQLLQVENSSLSVLELDFYVISLEQIEALAELSKNVRRFRVTCSAPFSRLMLLTNHLPAMPRLEHFILSLSPPDQVVITAGPIAALPAGRSRRTSSSVETALDLIDAVSANYAPASKDLRRFVKRNKMHTIDFKGRVPLLGRYSITRGSSLPKIEWQPQEPTTRKQDHSKDTTLDLTQGLPDDPAILSLLCQELGLEQRRGAELDDQIDEIAVGSFTSLDPFTDEWPTPKTTSEPRHARSRTVSSSISVTSTSSATSKPLAINDSGYAIAPGPKSKGWGRTTRPRRKTSTSSSSSSVLTPSSSPTQQRKAAGPFGSISTIAPTKTDAESYVSKGFSVQQAKKKAKAGK